MVTDQTINILSHKNELHFISKAQLVFMGENKRSCFTSFVQSIKDVKQECLIQIGLYYFLSALLEYIGKEMAMLKEAFLMEVVVM